MSFPSTSQRGGARSGRDAASDGDGGMNTLPQQLLSYLTLPFQSCLPSSSSAASHRQGPNDERQGLLTDSAYDDSDAISLLSNIADRSRRRNRSTRRREQWNRSAAVLGCGLFGRPKGQIQRRNVTLGDGERPLNQGHSRSDSVDSQDANTDDEGSVGRAASSIGVSAQESGDEDAGMLGDEAIAELSQTRDDDEEERAAEEARKKAEEEEAERKAQLEREAAEAAARKEQLEREAEETARAEAENAARQKAEEEALAAQQEAEVAKARRRAERKAIKQGLLQAKAMGQRETRRLTEAEAEAAAGGFDFAEEPQQAERSPYSPDDRPYYDEGDERSYARSSPYGMAPEGHGYYDDEHPNIASPQEVVHHHHYYREPQADEYEEEEFRYPTQQQFVPSIPQVMEHRTVSEDEKEASTAVQDEDEDDADIAGLAFSKNRRKRADRDGAGSGSYASRSNGSGSGRSGSMNQGRQYGTRNVGGSNSSAGRRREYLHDEATSSNGGGSVGEKQSYRDRPRRHHARTGSRSTGSASAARPLREGPGGKVITSPTIPEADSSRDGFVYPGSSMDATAHANDDQADAAAGGFDDFLAPPSHSISPTVPQPHSVQSPSYDDSRSRKDYRRTSPASSASASRRREGPRKTTTSSFNEPRGGLNAPRNPQGMNIFARRDDDMEEADEL